MNKLLLLPLGLILAGCASNPTSKSATFNNARYPDMPPEQGKAIFHRDFGQCKQLAISRVPMPKQTSRPVYTPPPQPRSYGVYNTYGGRVGTLRPEGSVAAPNIAGSFMSGFNASRNNPSAVYGSSIKSYTMACMQGKGWVKS